MKLHEIAYYTALKGQPISNFKKELEIEQMHCVKYSCYENGKVCADFVSDIAKYFLKKKKLVW